MTGRREFIATAIVAAAGCKVVSMNSTDAYSVAVLGDTHFDTEPSSVYHSNYDLSNVHSKIQTQEFARNGEMWKERCPKLINASAKLAKESRTAFILQMGDLIQGDCDDAIVHKIMLQDAVKVMKKPYPQDMPFLTVVGNHDYRGKGGREAYYNFVEPYMTEEILKLTGDFALVKYPAFAFKKGPDLWVFCNFETDKIDQICDLVESYKDVRYVFLVTHGPFTTCPFSRAHRWRLVGSKKVEGMRKRLYDILMCRRAIVLSGHTHTTSYYRFKNSTGSFCEFTANSVWSASNLATAVPRIAGAKAYKAGEMMYSDSRQEDLEREVDFFKGDLVDCYCSKGAGHYRLEVAPYGVWMLFYPGDSVRAAREFRLA